MLFRWSYYYYQLRNSLGEMNCKKTNNKKSYFNMTYTNVRNYKVEIKHCMQSTSTESFVFTKWLICPGWHFYRVKWPFTSRMFLVGDRKAEKPERKESNSSSDLTPIWEASTLTLVLYKHETLKSVSLALKYKLLIYAISTFYCSALQLLLFKVSLSIGKCWTCSVFLLENVFTWRR